MPFISGIYTPTPSNPTNWKRPAGKSGWWDRFSVEEVRCAVWMRTLPCAVLAFIVILPS